MSVLLEVHVPLPSIMHGGLRPRSAPAAVTLLNALFPSSCNGFPPLQADAETAGLMNDEEDVEKMEHRAMDARANASLFSLASCFSELPTCKGDRALPLMLKAEQEVPTRGCSPPTSLHDLDHEVMLIVMSKLRPEDLAAACCTCTYLNAIAGSTVPDLKLSLYPHQRTALRWMAQKEQHGRVMPHPFIKRVVAENSNIPIYVNLATGEILSDPPKAVNDVRGGFFCDEPVRSLSPLLSSSSVTCYLYHQLQAANCPNVPLLHQGLGKTVTALSLILKTKHMLPTPPAGAAGEWTIDALGRRNGFYYPSSPAALTPGTELNTNGSADDAKEGASGEALAPSNDSSQQESQNAEAERGSAAAPCCEAVEGDGQAVAASNGHEGWWRTLIGDGSGEESRQQSRLAGPGGTEGSEQAVAPAAGRSLKRRALAAAASVPSPPASGGAEKPREAKRRRTAISPAARHSPQSQVNAERRSPMQEEDCAGAKEEGGGVQFLWVQCDSCGKWRELAPGCAVDGDAPWFCHLHPEPRWRSCGVPEKYVVGQGERLVQCPGYLTPEDKESESRCGGRCVEISSFLPLSLQTLPLSKIRAILRSLYVQAAGKHESLCVSAPPPHPSRGDRRAEASHLSMLVPHAGLAVQGGRL